MFVFLAEELFLLLNLIVAFRLQLAKFIKKNADIIGNI